MQRFFGFADEDFGKTFAVLIQFGAILALLSIYFARLWQIAIGMFTDPAARRFVIGVLLAFLPAAVVGALAHDFIKSVLFNEWLVCFTLIVGGAVLLWIDMLESEAALSRRHAVHAADVFHHRPGAVRLDDPRRVALGRDHLSAPCCSAPTAARPPSSRSGSRCRPWPARSPTISTRAAAR